MANRMMIYNLLKRRFILFADDKKGSFHRRKRAKDLNKSKFV